MKYIPIPGNEILRVGDCMKIKKFDKLCRLQFLIGLRVCDIVCFMGNEFVAFYRPVLEAISDKTLKD